jgi:hypothetical protein
LSDVDNELLEDLKREVVDPHQSVWRDMGGFRLDQIDNAVNQTVHNFERVIGVMDCFHCLSLWVAALDQRLSTK